MEDETPLFITKRMKTVFQEAPLLENRLHYRIEIPNIPFCRGASDHGSFPTRSLTTNVAATKR
jgi:hypothetical protein